MSQPSHTLPVTTSSFGLGAVDSVEAAQRGGGDVSGRDSGSSLIGGAGVGLMPSGYSPPADSVLTAQQAGSEGGARTSSTPLLGTSPALGNAVLLGSSGGALSLLGTAGGGDGGGGTTTAGQRGDGGRPPSVVGGSSDEESESGFSTMSGRSQGPHASRARLRNLRGFGRNLGRLAAPDSISAGLNGAAGSSFTSQKPPGLPLGTPASSSRAIGAGGRLSASPPQPPYPMLTVNTGLAANGAGICEGCTAR